MAGMIETVNIALSVGTIALQVCIVVAAVMLFLKKPQRLLAWLGARGVVFAYLLSFAGMLFSLFYSEVAGYAPCVLCWYQRIFMYPLVFILALALYRNDRSILPYAKLLASVGLLIGLYQILLPVLPGASATCTFAGASAVSCLDQYFIALGYITIPVMSFTSWIALVGVLHLASRYVPSK
ncbi:MAG: hypothetical protein RL150_182 [Candidatus Parcubacteria bacterium]|jgi:disulfide bond formation protein DsbB